MTDAEKDAAWRSLPENIRREIRKEYNKLKYYWHITADRRNGAMASYENIFGKHNLTETEEEKPMFKVGDLVLVKKEFDFGSNFGLAYVFGVTPHPIKEIADGKAFLQNDWGGSHNSEYAMVPLDSLIPYTEERPKPKTMHIRTKHGTITIPTKIEYDDSVWLAYRMELAKEISPKLIVALSDGGISSDFCDNVIDKVATIVNGIVERLKGGDK